MFEWLFQPTGQERTGVRVLGAPRAPLRDSYHLFLRARWPVALFAIVAGYLLLNVVFACAYLGTGGIFNARDGAFEDAFFFSIQTMGTIGYGFMYPTTGLAHAIVVAESVTGLLVTALATGLVFSKFSQTSARIAFSKTVVIGPMDAVPTLMVRVGNERANTIVEATVRVAMVRTVKTKEGSTFYRMTDLRLVRERSQAVSRSWTVLHTIDKDSPLFGHTPESFAKEEVELLVSLSGVDDTSMQQVHARRRYLDTDILWGARHADVLTEEQDGTIVLDVTKFHDTLPTDPVADFPYPRAPATEAK